MFDNSWGKVVVANHSICRVIWSRHYDVIPMYFVGELYNIKEQPNSKQNTDITMMQTHLTAELRPFL